jgi:bacillithiol synthase
MSRARAAHAGPRAQHSAMLQIVAQPLGESPFLHDYQAAEPALASFYFGHPADGGAYDRKAAEVGARFDTGSRAAIATALQPVSAAAEAKLTQMVEAGGFVVTTGQQAGLFGGPLYSLYKALTAVRLAEALEQRLARPVLPVFWIAAEDHDWQEVNHTFVAGPDDRTVRIAVERAPGASEVSMARQPLGADVTRARGALEKLLPRGPDTDRLVACLQRAYRPDATVAEAFAMLMTELLAPFPVCLISAADPKLKALSAPVLRAELEHSVEHGAAVRRQTQRLERAGYPAQVAVEEHATNLHYEDGTGRERLLRAGGGFRLRRSKRRLTTAQLLAELERDPGCLSPGALLRPVVESAVLPTLAYVGGPAETAYFAQIGCLFRGHGLEPPVVRPRAAFVLVEPRIQRLLEKLGLAAQELTSDAETLTRERLDAVLPESAGAALAKLKLVTAESWSRLRAAAGPIDPTLEVPLRRLEKASMQHVDDAEKRLRQHQRRRHEVLAGQIERICGQLRPGGVPQERALNALPFLACHGDALTRGLAGAIDVRLEDADRWPEGVCTS